MTKRECAIVMAYTGDVTLVGNDLGIFYNYIEQIIGRRIYTHELTSMTDEIRLKSKPDFIKICQSAVDCEKE